MSQVEIDIQTKSSKWKKDKKIEQFINKTCLDLIFLSPIKSYLSKKNNFVELSISLVSDSQIKKINNQFRNKNKATDVLSFPSIDPKILKTKKPSRIFIGDIILSFETIEKEAKNGFYNHITHLILHSLLHLIGYDHELESEAKIMEEMEIKILKKLNIKNPYKQD